MRVVIWGDMEGIGGITHWDQVNGANPVSALYTEGQVLYTEEINAAVRGAKKAGALEIVAVDGHGAGGGYTFRSWVRERLEPGAEYVMGHRWGAYVEPFREGCEALLLVGYHAMAGTPNGVLSHTISSSNWYQAFINGTPVGECTLAAAIAGSFDVPVVFLSGDEAVCREVQKAVGPSVFTAQVKKGLERFCARCLAPSDARSLIESRVCEALSKQARWPKPLKLGSPIELKVEFVTPDKTNDFIGKSGVEITGPRTVVSRAADFWTAWDQFWHH